MHVAGHLMRLAADFDVPNFNGAGVRGDSVAAAPRYRAHVAPWHHLHQLFTRRRLDDQRSIVIRPCRQPCLAPAVQPC